MGSAAGVKQSMVGEVGIGAEQKGQQKQAFSVVVLTVLALLSNECFAKQDSLSSRCPGDCVYLFRHYYFTFVLYTHTYMYNNRYHGSSDLRARRQRGDIVEPDLCLLWLCVCASAAGTRHPDLQLAFPSLHLHKSSRERQTLPNHISDAVARPHPGWSFSDHQDPMALY